MLKRSVDGLLNSKKSATGGGKKEEVIFVF